MDFGSAVLSRVGWFPRNGSRTGCHHRSEARAAVLDRDRTGALVATLGVHVALALVLMQSPKPFTARDEAAFDVVFIERIPPPAVDSVFSEATDAVAQATAIAPRKPGLTVQVVPRTTDAEAMPAAEPASSIPATDDDRWDMPARPGSPPGVAFHDNVLERPMAITPPAPERFRMRRQRSPEAVVTGVAQLVGLWPPGYTDDPCPQISRNVEMLSQSADAASRRHLQGDTQLELRYCR